MPTNTWLSKGNFVLRGFTAEKTVRVKDHDDHKGRLVLENVQLVDDTVGKSEGCYIVLTGGAVIDETGELSPIATSSSFTLHNDFKYHLSTLLKDSWLTSVASVLSILEWRRNHKKHR